MDAFSADDVFVKKILETHAPDGQYIDPMPLLCLTESTIRFVMASIAPTHTIVAAADREHDMKIVLKDIKLGCIIHRISREMLRYDSRNTNRHKSTLALLELVENYAWNVKSTLVLAAVAVNYAEFALILQLCEVNPLALSLSLLKQLRNVSGNTKGWRSYFKSFIYLVGKMINVAKCIIKFESHHPDYVAMDSKSMAAVKAYIHVAAYWIVRSAVVCSSQITSMVAAKKHTNFIIASWELWSLASKLDNIDGHFRMLLDACHTQLEDKMQSVLLNLFEEAHDDNQKVLQTLLATKDEFPLRLGFSTEKIGVTELRDKVVVLLISQPQIPAEMLLLLTQQLSNCYKVYDSCFEVVWIPISTTRASSNSEERTINNVANTLPWYSIRKPSILSKSVANYMKKTWLVKDGPVLVVLDAQGKITASNAIDMVFVWGTMAYPFSASRERELWKTQSWSIKFLMNDIDPTISLMVEEGKPVSIYGSNDIEWIRRLCAGTKNIINSGIPMRCIYVGCNSTAEGIVDTISQENLSEYLQKIKAAFFWLRLRSMRESRLALAFDNESDHMIKDIDSLLSPEAISSGWLIISEGPFTDIVMLPGSDALDLLSNFQGWGAYVEHEGFLNSVRNAVHPREKIKHCSNYNLLPYEVNISQVRAICKECGGIMDKHTVFQCNSGSLTSPG